MQEIISKIDELKDTLESLEETINNKLEELIEVLKNK
jgi:hypothetical protein